jgi:serine protease Do
LPKNQSTLASSLKFSNRDCDAPRREEADLVKSQNSFVVLFLIFVFLCSLAISPAYAYTPKQIYQKAGPGVVFVFASKGSSKGSGGTGSIISPEGLVITNAHIFTQKDSSELLSDISIFLKPARVTGDHKTDLANGYKGKIIAIDLPLDLALVKIINPDRPLTTVPFADSEIVEIGDQVYAIGHPEQGGLWSLTAGVISAHWRNYGGVSGKHLFQTDASINRGNSGGPLLDQQGTMIGINSMIARKAADGLTITAVNFSIRSKVAIDWLNKNGYQIAAVRHETPAAQEPEKETAVVTQSPQKKVEAPPSAPQKETALTPQPPAKKTEDPLQPSKETQKQKVIATQQQSSEKEQPSLPTPPEKETSAPVKESQPPDKLIAETPKQGRILTEKKPYRMDDLLEGMREMEDLMDEMKDMIDDFKERRKK